MLSVKTSATVSPQGDSAHPTPTPGRQPLLTLFVAALTQDSDTAWRALLDHLASLPPAALRELRLQPETQHYIHRAVQHETKHSDRVGHLGITRRLATIFPEEVERFRTEELLCSYSYSDVAKFADGDMSKTSPSGLRKKRRKRAASVDSSTRDLFTFSPSRIPATYRAPTLTLKDLTAAATLVSYEASTAGRNSLLLPPTLHPAGTATRTSESHAIKTPRPHSSQGFYTPAKKPEKPFLSPVLSSEIEESHLVSPRSAGKRVHFQQKVGKSTSSSGPFKDAFDVIEAFATGKLHTESEAMYLNYGNSIPWNPYSLVVVPKMHANPEHFVISKFGILHIYPDGDCDLQNFAEWLQEASLFTMLRKIPFFRLCILRKAFSHWRRNVRYNQFLRVHNQVIKKSLRFFPSFSDGILKIQNLNQELLSVPFHTLLPLGGYSQEVFEQKLESSQAKLEKFLQRYFKYCRRIVAEVIESTQSHALELEMEKRHQPFVSELPLSIQKEKHTKLEKDLEVAQYRVTRLSNFVTLADNLVMICLLKLARQSAESWISTTLKQESDATAFSSHSPVDGGDPRRKTVTPVSEISSESEREAESRCGARTQCSQQGAALLLAELRFGEAGTLTIHPSGEELEVCLLGPLLSLTPTLFTATQALTGHPSKMSPIPSGRGRAIKAGNGRGSPLSEVETASTARPSTKQSIIEKRGQSKEHPQEITDLKEERRRMLLSTLPQRPKSLVKALRGMIADPPASGLGEQHREGALLESERAKQWLRAVGEGGGGGGEGRRIGMGVRPSALSEEKLKSVLERDEVLRVSLSVMWGAVNGVREEVKSICNRYSWMQEVWQFMHQWEGWGRMAALSAEEFEATLVQLYQWTWDLSLLPPYLPTPHCLVCVGTGELVGGTLPQLSAILAQLKARGMQHARRVCDRVLEQTKRHSEGLFSKRYDLEGFAVYARQLQESRAFHQREASNIDYVCRVHSVLLRQGVEVPPEDRRMGKELQGVWRELEQRLVEAGEFVDTQTPIKAQGLQESIESCEEELQSLVAQVNEGSFVEPAAVPSGLLERLKEIQEEVMGVRARLLGLSKWKEAITGKPHNLTNIASLLDVLFVRQELWKYRRVFDSYEREWMKTPFKKLDIAQISQRVMDWLAVCSKLEQTLPLGDPVLEGWKERLLHFKQGFPLLQQLASKALRTSHWFTIFAALGEDYIPFHSYTLTDFALYSIYEHSDIIFEICHGAMQEDKLRAEVVGIQEMWENKTFSVLQTPLDQYSFALASEDHLSAKKPPDKITTFAIGFSQPLLTTFDYLCAIDNCDGVQLLLEDNVTQLKVLLSSPHLGSLRSRAETLLTTLRQLQELISLTGECQQKWWNLLNLFSHMENSLRPSYGLEQLQQTTRRFQEVTRSIYGDPRVLSLLGKRRGQKGSRELQGDPLRHCLHSILSSLESVLQKVHLRVEEACVQFPRLCYLSDSDVLKVLAHRGIPVTLVPLIKRIFSSVSTLRFTEIIATRSPSHIGMDTEEGFQLIAVEGSHGEQLPLVSPLPLGKKQAPLWLSALDGAVKYSLACALTQCEATFPEGLMGVTGDLLVANSVCQWLGSYPQQSVLLSLELKWANAIYSAMTSDAPSEQLQQIRTRLHIAVDVAVELLRSLYRKTSHPSAPLPITIYNVIIVLRHKTDLVKSLIENKAFSPASLLWKGHIHYTSEGEFTSQLDEKLATHGRPSIRKLASIHSIGNSRCNDVAIQSSHSSLDQRSLVFTSRLHSSEHSLVASSKSLLSSKQMNEPHSLAGTSPLGVPRPSKCMVHCNDLTLPYGFEYYGYDSRLVLTPPTEACLLSVASAIGNYSFFSISGPPAVGKTKTAEEVAKVLGRHCYQFQLSPLTRPLTLHRLLSGALRAGSILLLEGSSSLVPIALVSLGEYLQSLATVLARTFATVKTSHPGQSQSSELSEGGRPTSRIDWYRKESLGGWPSSIHTTATVEFAGQLLTASSTFGCVLVESSGIENTTTAIPQQLKSILRPISLLKPALQCVGEVLLLSHGFTQAHPLSGKLALFLEHLHQQVSVSSKACCFGLLELKEIISLAALYLSQSILSHSDKDDEYDDPPLFSLEFQAVTDAIKELCGRRVAPVDSNKLLDLLEAYFPDVSAELYPSGKDKILQEALQSQFSERHLQSETALMDKIQELHSSLSRHRLAILTGLNGSSKSTAYRMLAAAYHHIRELQALGKHSSTTQGENYPRVDITVINPGAYSTEELFGCHQQVGGELQWRSGILTCLLHHMESSDHLKASLIHPDREAAPQNPQSCPVPVRYWVVLDGPVGAALMEALTALVSLEGLCLSNGEKLFLPDSCQLLVETPSLSTLTPSLLSHCTLIHFGRDIIPYEALIDTWLDRAPTKHNLSAMSTETLATMVKQLLPDALDFIQETNTKHAGPLYTTQLQSRVFGITETQCFLNLLSAVLERNSPKAESSLGYPGTASQSSRVSSRMTESRASSALLPSYSSTSVQEAYGTPRNVSHQPSRVDIHAESGALDLMLADNEDAMSDYSNLEVEIGLTMQIQMATILAFSYIWSIGAFVPFSELSSFDEFARDQIMQLPFAVPLPEEGSVFDYFLDLRRSQFLPWTERSSGSGRCSGGYITLPELDRYAYIVDLYLSYGFNVMIIGEQGMGKTAFVEHLLQSRMSLTRIPITHAFTSSLLHHSILDKVAQLEKRGQRLGGSKKMTPQRCIFFLDDLHLASKNFCTSGDYPVLETVRFAVSQNALIDPSRAYQHDLHNVRYIATCVPSGLSKVAPKLLGIFNPVPFLPPSDECLHQIFSKSVQLWLQQFSPSAVGDAEFLAEAIAAASIVVFRSVAEKFHPNPSQPHYLFTMHDLLHVYEGLLLMSPDTKAQAHPQFNLLNRRGFLSSTQSSRGPKKAKSGKTKSGKRISLPSLRGGDSTRGDTKTTVRRLSVPGPESQSAEMTTMLRMLIRLWCHENTRVYTDRLVDSKDRMWFLKLLEACMKYCFSGIDLQSSTTATQPLVGHTATHGGRRIRGGRMRTNVLPQSEGPSLASLAASGVKVEALQRLTPRNPEKGLQQLIPYDQLTMRGEDLTGLIFAHFPRVGKTEENRGDAQQEESSYSRQKESSPTVHDESGAYSELGDGQVMETLNRHLENYSGIRGKLVLFRGAIEHATRLCRVMSLPGSHALLLGSKGTGRKSLTRLVAHIMGAELFELAGDGIGQQQQEYVRRQLREVCISAGSEQKHSVLLVSSSGHWSPQTWQSICQLMNEGFCAGLFTSSELLVMSSKLQQGKMKKTADGAQQAFARSVQKNLHIFITWNIERKTGSPFEFSNSRNTSTFRIARVLDPGATASTADLEESRRAMFASLCRVCSHIDHYHPWSKQAYSDIALQKWQQSESPTWQSWADTGSQLEAVSILAAHVHLTTVELLHRTMPHVSTDLVSPKTFTECLRVTQSIAIRLKTQEKATADRLQSALHKLEEVDRTVFDLEQQLASLGPQLSSAEKEVQQRMALITAAKERYMAANRRCRYAEETIETESQNVEHLSKVVQQKFGEVSPVYHSALEALSSVKKNDVLEVMSYREPPPTLTPIFNALCMIFDRPQTWEDCKELLLSQNFFESLKFFDRDHVPVHKLHKLEKMIIKRTSLDSVEHGSKAAVSLCMWLTALVDYHKAEMVVQPFRERLAEAEKTLTEAEKTFVAMKKDMMETKAALEETIKLHKEGVQKARHIETEIKAVQSNLDKANHLLSSMSAQRQRWDEKLKATWNRIDSVAGHAVLCAASTTYLALIPADQHKVLMSNWLGYCSGAVDLGSLATQGQGGLQSSQAYHSLSGGQQQVVRIERNFVVLNVLSDREERFLWQQEATFPDQVTLERCLAACTSCKDGSHQWPLVVDPHEQFWKYLRAIEHKESRDASSTTELKEQSPQHPSTFSSLVIFKVSEAELSAKLQDAISSGKTTALILDFPPTKNKAQITSILKRDFTRDSSNKFCLELEDDAIPVHPDFRLYVVTEQYLGSDQVSQVLRSLALELSDFSVVNLNLSREGLQSHLQRFIMNRERPKFSIRYKSLITDLALHHQQLEDSQEQIIYWTLASEDSLLQCSSLLPTVREKESAELNARDQILETNKILRTFDQQVEVYRPLAEYATTLFGVVQKLSETFLYFKLRLNQFQKLVADLIAKYKDRKVADNTMAVNAHVLHLKHELLLALCRALQPVTFRQHQTLLPLFVSLEMLLAERKATEDEYQLLGKELNTVEVQLEILLNNSSELSMDKPHWMSDQVWCAAMELQKHLPALRKLGASISSNTSEWKEYFELPPSLFAPVPSMGDSVSMCHKLLLWKTFRPDKFVDVAKQFVILTLGPEVAQAEPSTVDSILPHTKPEVPVVCLLPFDVQDTQSAVLEVETSAVAQGRSFLSVSLVDDQSLDNLLIQLPNFIGNGTWVAVEHCHLSPNWHHVLASLFKAVTSHPPTTFNPEFRMWVLLPVDVCSGLDFGENCLKVALESNASTVQIKKQKGDGGSLCARRSLKMLQDIQLVMYSSAKPLYLSWEKHRPIISKLQNFIPLPLSESELSELKICDMQGQSRSQSLLALFSEELSTHNTALEAIHASLRTILGYLSGNLPYSASLGHFLASLSQNEIPNEWQQILPLAEHQIGLVPALKLLKTRVKFYTNKLQSGLLPKTLHPLLFSNPSDLFSRVMHSFAQMHQLFADSAIIDAKLIVEGSESDIPEGCITLHGLTLHGATWNTDLNHLEPMDDCNSDKFSALAPQGYCITIFPASTVQDPSAMSSNILECPVVLAKGLIGQHNVSPLFHVPLKIRGTYPVCIREPTISLYLACDLPV